SSCSPSRAACRSLRGSCPSDEAHPAAAGRAICVAMSERDPIRAAVQQLRRLPGIGEKSATRLVYWLLRAPPGTASDLAGALAALAEGVCECSRCCDLTSSDPCRLCALPGRDDAVVCVVEEPQDVLAFERSGEFRGRYHVLHGALSPLEGR